MITFSNMRRVRWGLGALGMVTLQDRFVEEGGADTQEANELRVLRVEDGDVWRKLFLLSLKEKNTELWSEMEVLRVVLVETIGLPVDGVCARRWLLFWPIIGVVQGIELLSVVTAHALTVLLA